MSIIYIVIDTICIVFFFDAFANRRWNNLSFWVVAFAFILIFGCGLFFNQAFFDNDPIIKIIFVISTTFIMGVILYCRISILQILLLSVIEYLLNYALSFGIGMLFSSVYGINGNTFLSERIPFIIYSIFFISPRYFRYCYFENSCFAEGLNKRSSNWLRLRCYYIFCFLVHPLSCSSHFFILRAENP